MSELSADFKKDEGWDFCSLSRRLSKSEYRKKLLTQWTTVEPAGHLSFVNTPIGENEIRATRYSINCAKPFDETNQRYPTLLIL